MVIREAFHRRAPASPLISAADRQPMTYGGLDALMAATVRFLNRLGAGRRDRIAAVLPNGPELASAFLAISAGAVFAPLNPAYSAPEFEFYLRDLSVRFLVTQEGFCEAATRTATALGIPIVLLRPVLEGPAGAFVLEGGGPSADADLPGFSEPGDTALLLHSSGTTARPKLIPLTHRNLMCSAANIAGTLALTPADISMNVMPLFHIHGLVGALLASAVAGSSVYCTPGFNALGFWRLLRDSGASWYTAVPTMHQLILGRGESRGTNPRLRFVRSSSAHLNTKLGKQLEDRFECPVLNTYGMTEASHQVAGNPLPPGVRKPGTVGISHATRFATLDENGNLQHRGGTGEVAIQGDAVMCGYVVPTEANEAAFRDGWLRTGDLGAIDQDGYLTLTGRIKEIINCGGEKVSPAEIDEVLLQHPHVSSAVCFAAPCPNLGERICAAVVLAAGARLTEADLQRFAGDRLARFKIPRQILILDDIPRGATGKIQRIGMAQRLGLGAATES